MTPEVQKLLKTFHDAMDIHSCSHKSPKELAEVKAAMGTFFEGTLAALGQHQHEKALNRSAAIGKSIVDSIAERTPAMGMFSAQVCDIQTAQLFGGMLLGIVATVYAMEDPSGLEKLVQARHDYHHPKNVTNFHDAAAKLRKK